MSFNTSLILSGLTEYVDQLTQKTIIVESVMSSRTAKLVNVQSGVKGTQALNLINTNQNWQAAACGLISTTASIALTQQYITVKDLMNTYAICQVGAGSLAKYWTGVLQPKGIHQPDPSPREFAEALITNETLKNGDFLDHAYWVSCSGTQSFSTYGGMELCDGFLSQLNFGAGHASVVSCTASGGVALTTANAVSVVNNMISNSPQDVADKPQTLWMSLTNYRTLIVAMLDKQTFNSAFFVKDTDGTPMDWAINWPYAQNVKVVTTPGLAGRNDLVLSPDDNLYIGRDGESDEEEFEIWEDKTFNSIFMRTMVRVGTAVARPQYVVYQSGGYN